MKEIIIRSLALILLIGLTTTAYSQETIDLNRFDKIVVAGTIDIILEEGEKEQAVLRTRNFDKEDVKIYVSEGVLRINVLKSLIKSGEKLEAVITYRRLNSIKAQAGAEIEARNTITTDYLELKARSGSAIELDLQVDDLLAIATEGSQISLSGSVESQEVKAGSGGEIHGFDLNSDYAYVTANAGGQVEVHTKERIEASANAGGQITYKGKPASSKVKDFLGGNIREL